jgi:hypothetical protein
VDAVDAAADGAGACDVGAVDPTDEPATAGFVLGEAVDGGAAALDDETGLQAVTLTVARLAAPQTRPNRDTSVNLILITPSSWQAPETAP